jgi:hypothetical protein
MLFREPAEEEDAATTQNAYFDVAQASPLHTQSECVNAGKDPTSTSAFSRQNLPRLETINCN